MSSDLPDEEPSPEVRAHFESTPWCAALFHDPNLQPFRHDHKRPHQPPTVNTFLGNTLATKDTITAWQFFRTKATKPAACVSILSMGSGVNGHADTCHGGFIGVILDEVLGNVADLEKPDGKATMTAYLKVDYKKPVRTPGKVLCRGFVEKKEGRKLWVRGTLEDGNGTILVTAEGLFLVVDQVKPLERL